MKKTKYLTWALILSALSISCNKPEIESNAIKLSDIESLNELENLFGFNIKTGHIGSLPLWNVWYVFLLLIVAMTIFSGAGYFVKYSHLYEEST